MKKIIAGVVLLLALFAFFKASPRSTARGGLVKVLVGGKQVSVEIADTPIKREQGLSDKENLCSNCGMLFIFDTPGIYPFWMRRMHFDIDILWISGDRVVDITLNAKKPSIEDFDRPKEIYQSKTPADKVLEVNAGWVEKNGIKIGDKVSY